MPVCPVTLQKNHSVRFRFAQIFAVVLLCFTGVGSARVWSEFDRLSEAPAGNEIQDTTPHPDDWSVVTSLGVAPIIQTEPEHLPVSRGMEISHIRTVESTGYLDLEQLQADYAPATISDQMWLEGQMLKTLQMSLDQKRQQMLEVLIEDGFLETDAGIGGVKDFLVFDFSPEVMALNASRLVLQLEKTPIGLLPVEQQLSRVMQFAGGLFGYIRQSEDGMPRFLLVYNGTELLSNLYPDIDMTVPDEDAAALLDEFYRESLLIYQDAYKGYTVDPTVIATIQDIHIQSPIKGLDWESITTSAFGKREDIFFDGVNLSEHTGLDLAWNASTEIHAAQDGHVVKVENSSYGYGNYIILDHGGYQTLYGHCAALQVELDQVVHKGDIIATMGQSGWATGSHVHFEVLIDGVPLDPAKLLN